MKKLNNNGFSLVELIIVIAIMAVLIAVMAPSFLRYVEKTRANTDIQNANSLVNAVEVWATDVEAGITPGTTAITPGSGSITVKKDGASVSGELTDEIQSALNNAGFSDLKTIKCHANSTWSTGTWYRLDFTVHTDGSMTVIYTPSELDGHHLSGTT